MPHLYLSRNTRIEPDADRIDRLRAMSSRSAQLAGEMALYSTPPPIVKIGKIDGRTRPRQRTALTSALATAPSARPNRLRSPRTSAEALEISMFVRSESSVSSTGHTDHPITALAASSHGRSSPPSQEPAGPRRASAGSVRGPGKAAGQRGRQLGRPGGTRRQSALPGCSDGKRTGVDQQEGRDHDHVVGRVVIEVHGVQAHAALLQQAGHN